MSLRSPSLVLVRPLALTCVLIAAAPAALAQEAAETPLDLATIMADPDWIGNGVERAWWSWDGTRALYARKREGANVRDTWTVALDGASDGAAARKVADGERAALDAPSPVYDATRTRMAFARNGDIFVRELRSGALSQLTRTAAQESRPQWGSDGGLVWRAGNEWFRWSAGGGTARFQNV